MEYVTYDADGTLTGSYMQDLQPEHTNNYVQVDSDQRVNWTSYKYDLATNSLVPYKPAPNIAALKAKKNLEINTARMTANTSFYHGDKEIASDSLSLPDIYGVANHILLCGTFPENFPYAWKAVDNTYIPIPDIEAFKQFYTSMTTAGTANFHKAQLMKSKLESAQTEAQIDSIRWEDS